jgi:hypothetical protein
MLGFNPGQAQEPIQHRRGATIPPKKNRTPYTTTVFGSGSVVPAVLVEGLDDTAGTVAGFGEEDAACSRKCWFTCTYEISLHQTMMTWNMTFNVAALLWRQW